MSKKKVSKKASTKKETNLRYAVHIPAVKSEEDMQRTRFTVVKEEYPHSSNSILFLPKKIDSLIKKIEKLGVHVVDIEVGQSKYNIRFVEDEKSSGAADLLYDVYVNNPCDYVFFIWAERYSEYPKSFDLVINFAGETVYPTNELLSKFGLLSNTMNTFSELKDCSKYIDIVLDAINKGKKDKLKALYEDKE